MMRMCLSFSLLHPEDPIIIQNSLPIAEQENYSPQLQVKSLPTVKDIESPIQHKELIPLENAIVPYQPPVPVNDTPDFDLMSLITEVENDGIPDEELLVMVTQCEQSVTPVNQNAVIPTMASNKTAVMRRSTTSCPSQTFTGCTFGSVGTINIHIHKH